MVAASIAAKIGSFVRYWLQGRSQRKEWAHQDERARQEQKASAERDHQHEGKRAAIRVVALEA